jgi:branched-chain amino acid aminotransferase
LYHFVNFNGTLLDATASIVPASNRSLRYGDGLFETMRREHQKILLEDFHFERLFQGLKILQFELPAFFTPAFLSGQIRDLCEKNNQPLARIRLNVFREESPAFLPVNNRPQYIIESADLPDSKPEPVSLAIYDEERKATGIFSNLKTNNYLLYLMAAKQANQNGFNDSLILNTADRICEATTSNVFFIKDRKLYTPPLSEGCVAGVKRRELLGLLPGLGFPVNEFPLSKEMILDMDEGFLTNAIRGIQPVARIENRVYQSKFTETLIHSLAERSGKN